MVVADKDKVTKGYSFNIIHEQTELADKETEKRYV